MPTTVSLITTYELGHQPFGVASAAAALRDVDASVTIQDLSINSLDEDTIGDFVGIYVPMHTATRLAEPVIQRIRALQPNSYICLFGLYAAMNEDHLLALGADSVLSGEYEQGLVDAYRLHADGHPVPRPAPISLQRRPFKVPDRSGLPSLDLYARLRTPEGESRVVGYTEATRGCKHTCRHCPIVPVYQGRFVVVEPDVVLADIRQQVSAGAQHITFGDPDFLNGPAHALRIVRRLHDEFPTITYDVTVKVEHLKKHGNLLHELVATGCVLVTTAIESFDDDILERFDKSHTKHDLVSVLAHMRSIGLALNPTFVTFTPWTTVAGYVEFLRTLASLGLVESMSPIQYAIRLLVPAGSKLLELPEIADLVDPFDGSQLCHPWSHPDPEVDRLLERVTQIAASDPNQSKVATFKKVWTAANDSLHLSADAAPPPDLGVLPTVVIPYLTEPWYC